MSWDGDDGNGVGSVVGGVQGHSFCALIYAPYVTPYGFCVGGYYNFVEEVGGEAGHLLGCDHHRGPSQEE